MDILDAIGNTSLVQLRKVVPPRCADVFVKLEWETPRQPEGPHGADRDLGREEDGR